ncbi:uncharacterized protein BDV17DRAFT_52978 [Aspergillus undulatus]|uniref:uncharacterized protein n=1 Tax=Aspergillus undulatus TaxID=1810928 RepID=UPI003CCD0AB9
MSVGHVSLRASYSEPSVSTWNSYGYCSSELWKGHGKPNFTKLKAHSRVQTQTKTRLFAESSLTMRSREMVEKLQTPDHANDHIPIPRAVGPDVAKQRTAVDPDSWPVYGVRRLGTSLTPLPKLTEMEGRKRLPDVRSTSCGGAVKPLPLRSLSNSPSSIQRIASLFAENCPICSASGECVVPDCT